MTQDEQIFPANPETILFILSKTFRVKFAFIRG
jgi:hypothetical protein